MSIEIRHRIEGECRHPGPYSPGETPTCHHWWECDWGPLLNTEADPRDGLHHLMLATADVIQRLLHDGPEPAKRGEGIISVTRDDDRLFFHHDSPEGKRTTWELFDTHFEDGKGPEGLLLGRWPD